MKAHRAWLRIAWRELRGGVAGFWVYLMCLALGAWAIAAAGSVTDSFDRGLTLKSRLLLGGDALFSLSQRLATDEEKAWLATKGTVSEVAAVDQMGRAGEVVRQIDLRGVDGLFPLVGEVTLNPGAPPLANVLEKRGEVWGIAASQSMLDDFNVPIGGRLTLGEMEVEIRAVLVAEPDRLGTPGAFQGRAIISIDALKERDLLATGRLFRTSYRINLNPGAGQGLEEAARARWGNQGLRYRGPEDAIEGLRNLIDMLNVFMSVVGVASLVAGGVGVSQATASFLETRLDSIAALKALGADAGTIRAAYALQLGALAALGSAIGVVLGAFSPWILQMLAGDRIPLPTAPGLFPFPLVKAFLLGMLAAVLFAAPALGRARATPPAALFRRMGDDGLGRTPAFERILSVLAGVGLVLLAMFTSPRPIVTLGLLVAAGVAYGVLIGAARLVKFIARRGSKGTRGYLRLALASLGGPGSLAPIVAPALGLGLSLMCMIATIQANILGQLRDTAPANAPSIIFRQIPSEVGADFDAMMKAHGVDTGNLANYRRAPFLLGRVLSVKGVPTRDLKLANDQRWVIRGEMPMTYIGPAPPELQLASGKWWAADYAGPLLVSVEQETADALGVRVGDHLAFRFFGRDLEAEVSSIRKVDWSGFGVSMAFVFSPGTLEAARPFATALVRLPPDKEDALVREVADRWPGILAFQLRRTLETAADLFQDVSKVVTILASVVTLAGVLVLFGAFAAAARRRRRESALLKTFGATRAGILALYAGEFGLAGLAAAILGAAMGVLAANRVVAEVLKEVTWRFSWGPVLTVSLIAVAAAATGGAVVGWATLSHRPARVLRSA